MAQVTPMMRQYLDTKEKCPGAILFFRLGDFYEMFFEDAVTVSRELELTLTGKDCGLEERAPMCGVPFHSADGYIKRLTDKGYRVAICEQMTDPALSKGLVEREIIRIVTPGTSMDGQCDHDNLYVACVCFEGARAGIAYADVSTGEFRAREMSAPAAQLRDELSVCRPREVLSNDTRQCALLCPEFGASPLDAACFGRQKAANALSAHFHQSVTALGGASRKLAVRAAGALMQYLSDTQKNALLHITRLVWADELRAMPLDAETRRNLELTESQRDRARTGSLLWVLDRTATSMGARLLKQYIDAPLCGADAIEARLAAVDALYQDSVIGMSLFEALRGVYDMERLLSRVAYASVNARDCLMLRQSLLRVPEIKTTLQSEQNDSLRALAGALDPLTELGDLLERAIHPDAPLSVTEGGIIRAGYSAELDTLRDAALHGKEWIADLEKREREETGIKNLRIQYNRVFGYYIEVTRSNYELVPMRYTRRQTLAASERFTTEELSKLERTVTDAQAQAIRLESVLFQGVRDKLQESIPALERTAEALKTLDALLSLARAARENNYVKPEMTRDGSLNIVQGRHPVVEKTLRDQDFVPNDTDMNMRDSRMHIITGPNMAGKSTYMRQVALITLMAHMGSFVPAYSARIPVVDRVFTRVGASDDLASGQSTFMVEMTEVARILNHATERSLVILDEVGRGTSTFDGLSIAWAVVEHITNKLGCKALFATHYHELSELERVLPGVRNFCVVVREHGEEVIFLRKIVPGGADKSYGAYVAQLAGVPRPVVMRAREIMARLEASSVGQGAISQNILETGKKRVQQVELFSWGQTELLEEIGSLDIMAMTPMDALNKLFLLKEKAKRATGKEG